MTAKGYDRVYHPSIYFRILRYTEYIILFDQLKSKVLTKYNIRIDVVRRTQELKDVLAEITRLRLKRKWSEYELSQHSGLSQSTISTWYGKNQVPTVQTLDKVCKGFGITLSQFFAEEEEAISLTPAQRELLDHWAALTETQQSLFAELFKTL